MNGIVIDTKSSQGQLAGDQRPAIAHAQLIVRRSGTKFADSPLEENGFKLPVPREISSGFEASAELRPIDRRRGGIIRVFGRMSSQPIEHKR